MKHKVESITVCFPCYKWFRSFLPLWTGACPHSVLYTSLHFWFSHIQDLTIQTQDAWFTHFSYFGPNIWNSLSFHLRHCSALSSFQTKCFCFFVFLFVCFLNCAATPATTSIQLHSVSVCLSLSPCLCQSVCLSPSLSFSLSDGVCMHECFSCPSLHPTPLSPCVTSNTCKIVIVSTGLTVMYMSDLQWLLRTESMKRPRHRCVQHKYTLVVVVVIVVTM